MIFLLRVNMVYATGLFKSHVIIGLLALVVSISFLSVRRPAAI